MQLDSRKYGYKFDKNKFEFYCCKEEYPDLLDSESVYVTGTFNGWLSTGDSDWLMTRKNEKGKTVFVLEKNLENIMVPGNSGYPEFKFFGLSETSCHLLAEKIENDSRVHFGTMPVCVKRNAYGRQLGSFFTEETFGNLGKIPMTFIRAPYIESAREDVEVLSKVDGKIVAAKFKNQTALSFHPELNNDARLYEWWIKS